MIVREAIRQDDTFNSWVMRAMASGLAVLVAGPLLSTGACSTSPAGKSCPDGQSQV